MHFHIDFIALKEIIRGGVGVGVGRGGNPQMTLLILYMDDLVKERRTSMR